jgi:hypothetical protein
VPRPLYPWERPSVSTEWETGFAPQAVWTDLEKRKSLACGGLRTPNHGPVASRYTDYAIPAHHLSKRTEKNQDKHQPYAVSRAGIETEAKLAASN